MVDLGPTLLLYLLIGIGVAVAVYVRIEGGDAEDRWLSVATAIPFWPIYLPLLLVGGRASHKDPSSAPAAPAQDEMASAINQVDAELEAALNSLDGWAEDVLARERDRIQELRSAWTAQSERIREMDRLLARPECFLTAGEAALTAAPLSPTVSDRLRRSQLVCQQNLERLRQVRRQAYEDLMATLAWVRELVSMIHLAKFTGAPPSRAEELVAQIAAAVEGLTELTWQDEPSVPAGDNT
jgi:hypothetical protein